MHTWITIGVLSSVVLYSSTFFQSPSSTLGCRLEILVDFFSVDGNWTTRSYLKQAISSGDQMKRGGWGGWAEQAKQENLLTKSQQQIL